MKKDNLCQNNVSDLPVNYLKTTAIKMFQQSKYSAWTQRWQLFSFLFGKSELAQADYNMWPSHFPSAGPVSVNHHKHIELEMLIKQTNMKNQRKICNTKNATPNGTLPGQAQWKNTEEELSSELGDSDWESAQP